MVRATLLESEIRNAIGLAGGGDLVVDGVASLDAGVDRGLYFVNRDLPADARDALATRRGCIVIAPSGSGLSDVLKDCRVLEVPQPRTAIARILAFIRDEGRQQPWVGTRRVSERAVVSPLAVLEGSVDIADGVVIEPFCTIGPDVTIGRDTVVRAGARIGPRVSIGERSNIGLNAVVGAEGFGFVRDESGHKLRVPHLGGIVIGSHVEIGALAVIQHGTISPTIVEDHAKIDVQVAVGHNSRIGRSVSLIGGTIIGGSVVLEEDVWVGLNATICNGLRVGRQSLVGMDASIQHDMSERTVAIARPAHLGQRSADDDEDAIGFTKRSIEPRVRKTPPAQNS